MQFQNKLVHFAVCLVCMFHLYVHAQTEDLGNKEEIKTISSTQEACQKLNHKLLINVDLMYYFKDCALHPIADPQLANMLIQTQGKEPTKISTKVYAALPLRSNYTYEDYYNDFPTKPNQFSPSVCKKFNGNIVSLDDYNYYYIEDCKKRKFSSYTALQEFNTLNRPIHAISNFNLNRFSDGKPITASEGKEENIKETPEEDLKKILPDNYSLCKNLNNKVAAFYESFYYVEKCVLLPIKDFTVALQEEAQTHGGIQDLSVEQALGLEEGKEISAKEVLKKLQ